MIVVLLSSALFPMCAPSSLAPATIVVQAKEGDVDAKIAAAGRNVTKLLDAAKHYAASGKADAAKKVYAKVLEIDPNNEVAHKALNHVSYEKKWFESTAELTKYKKEEAERPKGKVRWKDGWVPEADLPFLEMSWVRDDRGEWTNPLELAQLKQQADWRAAHFTYRADDDSWVSPDDKAKWAAGQWKCGEDWLDLAKANDYHSKLGQWWRIAGDHFVVWTTCDWQSGSVARWHSDQVFAELERIFDVKPDGKPHFVVLNSLDQYNAASGGTSPPLPESEGVSSLQGAYFADNAFDFDAKPPQYLGAGVCYWDHKDAKLKPWGLYWLRWAAAQSYVDAIDPSWGAVAQRIVAAERGSNALMPAAAFWGEKKIPRWLRYGSAAYVERFMKNPDAAKDADPWDLRTFAFSEIKKGGGLQKLDEVFAFALDVNKVDASARLYQQAGLVVSFLLDGAEGNKELAKKHDAFKTALKSGARADIIASVEALQKELVKSEPAIKKFAGL
jgi:hypothetical protein